MKTSTVIITGLAALAMSTTLALAQGLTLNFASNTGDSIIFGGTTHTFTFNNGNNGYQWNITGESGGSSAMGFMGAIYGGPFSYGTISSQFGGILQSALVTGPLGNLAISDGSGGTLTGVLNWMDISTLFQSVGIVNAMVQLNVTDLVYNGTNPDLRTLVANQPASLGLSFQFSPGASLTDLSTGTGPYSTSFSGSISVVPEPSMVAMAAVGGLGLLLLRRKQ